MSASNPSANRLLELPNADGTLATQEYVGDLFKAVTKSTSVTAPNGTSADLTYTLTGYSDYKIIGVTCYFVSKVIKPYIIGIDDSTNKVTYYTENTYGSSLARDITFKFLLMKK